MKTGLLKCIAIVMLIITAVSFSGTTAFASSNQDTPYDSYTYWSDVSGIGRKNVNNRTMYEVDSVLNSTSLNLESFTELIDVCTDEQDNIYLLDSNSKIIALDKNYNLINQIGKVISTDTELDFVGAQSIYVDSKNYIYICDTNNGRVLVCDSNATLLKEYVLPDSPLIPEDFDFKPIRVVADSKGYVYILSEGSYYGALLYAPDGSFIGFYGSNAVTNGIIGGVKSLFKRMFPNNEKASRSKKVLPYCFTDMVIDEKGFVFTATDSGNKGQIKKLNPGEGTNIMVDEDIDFLDYEVNRTYKNGVAFTQKIIGLDIDKNGFIYGLDATYGRVFVYDTTGRMITAFGGGMGNGTQKGTFKNASAVAVNGQNKVFVCDKVNNTLTVFKCNEYGNEVLKLIHLTLKGDYSLTKDGWQEVLKLDKNLQIAYSGLARAYLAEEDYDKAMEYAKEGYDRKTYALAFEYSRNEWLLQNLKYVFIAFILLVGILISAIIIMKKKNIAIIKNRKVKLMFNTLIHPGDTFECVKDNNMGSIWLSVIVVILFYFTAVIQVLCGGFLFTKYDPATYNSLWVFVQSAGLIILWAASNWLICTLMGGKGKLKEIFIVTSYSLIPLIFGRIIWVVLSNFLLTTESAILGIVTAVSIIYTFIILVIGMLRIHEFTMSRFIGTSLLTVLGMAAIIFLLILIGILVQQFGGFISTILVEIFM